MPFPQLHILQSFPPVRLIHNKCSRTEWQGVESRPCNQAKAGALGNPEAIPLTQDRKIRNRPASPSLPSPGERGVRGGRAGGCPQGWQQAPTLTTQVPWKQSPSFPVQPFELLFILQSPTQMLHLTTGLAQIIPSPVRLVRAVVAIPMVLGSGYLSVCPLPHKTTAREAGGPLFKVESSACCPTG